MDMKSLAQKQIDEDQIFIKLFEEKYSFIFYDPTYKEVPNVSILFQEKRIQHNISGIENYLLGSYPINMGTNVHAEMNDLRQFSFSNEEYKWHQKHNKLGLNCWGTYAGIFLIGLNNILGRNDLLMEPFPQTDKYGLMSFGEKLELCLSVDKKLYAILEKVYSEYCQG